MNTKVFMLFADCIPVAGFKRALICDLGRGQITLIPKSLYYFIQEFEGNDMTELIDTVDSEKREIVNDYIKHLEDRELIFWCTPAETALFPKIKPKWQSSSTLSNVIIAFNPSYNYMETLFELDQLGCSYYQFRLTDLNSTTRTSFYSLLQTLCEKCNNLNMFEVMAPHQHGDIDEQFVAYMKRYIQLGVITFYNHSTNSHAVEDNILIRYKAHPLHTQQTKSLGSMNNFFPNYDFFFESRTRNPYYNGKVTIDFEGGIKNVVSDMQSLGNIHTHSVTNVINQPNFKHIWSSTKDKIKGCQDCEFRYVCFDTRPLVYNEADQVYEPTIECNYDPYTGEWRD